MWEDEFIADGTIAPSMEKEAVLLRLEAGSQEAGHLAAIFPLPKTPTLVMIKNSDLKEYIAAGVAKDEFVRRVSKAFEASRPAAPPAQAASSGSAPTPTPTPAPTAETSVVPGGTAHDQQAEVERVERQQAATRDLALEGERRRQAARQAQKEREDIERKRKAKGKEAADATPGKPTDAVTKASQQLAERKRVAREERQRVLKLIEDDKAERRARDEMRRAEREAARAAAGEEGAESAAFSPNTGSAGTGVASQMRRRHDQCSLQVRLFDGSTIRTRLPSKSNMRDVRKWIDESREDGKDPYTFKVILTPMPNKSIDATEEEKSLEDLELTPSSTLILIPVGKYSTAHDRGNGNPISRLIAAILGFLAYIFGFLGLGGSRGATRPAPEQTPQEAAGRYSSRITGSEKKNDRRKDQQFYNGNSVGHPQDVSHEGNGANNLQTNFEPRKDDEEQEKK